jgi:hypothetical protein
MASETTGDAPTDGALPAGGSGGSVLATGPLKREHGRTHAARPPIGSAR